MTGRYKIDYCKAASGNEPAPRAKRSLGQNFLRDANIARKIVAALGIRNEDAVLEIGPGPGALTGIIQSQAPSRLVLVEKDAHWARERMREGGGGTSVIVADALTLAWERFDSPWKFIGNLPYNVASPLMWEVFSRAGGLTRAVFMIQKEVGQRIAAKPGSSAYGALSVWIQSFMSPVLEFIVPPQVFFPRPKVDSAVLSFEPLPAAGRGFSPEELSRTLKACFQMRRKQLGTIAKVLGRTGPGAPDLLRDMGFDPRLRPEDLTPQDFHRLSKAGIF